MTFGKNNQASTEFKLMVQPESGAVLVTQSSQRLLSVTVALASEAYFWTPFVMTVCAEAEKKFAPKKIRAQTVLDNFIFTIDKKPDGSLMVTARLDASIIQQLHG